ncbi:unnamed protein product [Haemonchus placei]|uniref:GSDH domain-containing protein n=1 Tax=Haemonchus placei TaxID=6290 RepID=A0A0N4WYR3_HAEPC|nr:unnamed protein product [Haemonchus placei]
MARAYVDSNAIEIGKGSPMHGEANNPTYCCPLAVDFLLPSTGTNASLPTGALMWEQNLPTGLGYTSGMGKCDVYKSQQLPEHSGPDGSLSWSIGNKE